MLLKDIEYRSDAEWKRRLSDLFYVLYNPAWTLPAGAALALFNPSLRVLFGLHVLNLLLFKIVPMWRFGPNADMDLSNHVSSVLFVVVGATVAGMVSPLPGAAVFAAVAATAVFSVVVRGQHDVWGALLGAASSGLIWVAAVATEPVALRLLLVTGTIAVLYGATMLRPYRTSPAT